MIDKVNKSDRVVRGKRHYPGSNLMQFIGNNYAGTYPIIPTFCPIAPSWLWIIERSTMPFWQ